MLTVLFFATVISLSFILGITQTFGWVYSLAFAFSAVPQALKSYREGHSRGVASGTLILWMIGEIGGLVYGFGLKEYPILLNCSMNTIYVSIICYYKLRPRKL